jgi:hypothetical protein
MKLKIRMAGTLVIAVVVLLLGCASPPKPFTYQPNTEIKEGPGLFSGEKGEIVLYDSKQKGRASNAPADPEADHAVNDQTAPAGGPDEEEFRQFRQWQQEQQELERFKEWKNSPQGQKELEEFRQWQRWQEYQKWRQSHPEAK